MSRERWRRYGDGSWHWVVPCEPAVVVDEDGDVVDVVDTGDMEPVCIAGGHELDGVNEEGTCMGCVRGLVHYLLRWAAGKRWDGERQLWVRDGSWREP